MKTIEDFQRQLLQMYQELEECKLSGKTKSDSQGLDAVALRAKRSPIINHPMKGRDEYTQEMYLELLLSVAALDDNEYENSFYTIYRIAYGMVYNGDIQALFLKAKKMDVETIDEYTRLFMADNNKMLLVTECLIIAGAFRSGKQRALNYIADICSLLKIEGNILQYCANMARAILTLDPNEFKCNLYCDTNIFSCYIDLIYNNPGNNRQIELITIKNPARKISSIRSVKIEKKSGYSLSYVYYYDSGAPSDTFIKNVADGMTIFGYRQKIIKINSNDSSILMGFAANSLLLYTEAKNKYLAQGGIIDNE